MSICVILVAFAVVESPICPLLLFPNTYTLPSSAFNMLVQFPAEISLIEYDISFDTTVVSFATPHSPYVFFPQEYTTPLVDKAKLCASPQEILAILLKLLIAFVVSDML